MCRNFIVSILPQRRWREGERVRRERVSSPPFPLSPLSPCGKFTLMEKVVLITGASSGIGLHTAKLFQIKNWKVAATMRAPDAPSELDNIVDVEKLRLD